MKLRYSVSDALAGNCHILEVKWKLFGSGNRNE